MCVLWNNFGFVNDSPKSIARSYAAYSSLKMHNRSNQLLLIASSIKPDSRQDIVFTESVSVFLVLLRTWQIQPVILQCWSPRLPLLLRCCLDWKKNHYPFVRFSINITLFLKILQIIWYFRLINTQTIIISEKVDSLLAECDVFT